jgi:carotenoid cleavage dioxygenase-like enzyme
MVALTETRLPARFDADTLATLGVAEYDREIEGPVSTAHPHFDAARQKHYSYVLDFGRRSTYRFFAIDALTGVQSVLSTLSVERPAYVHSFGMSEQYLVFLECPFVVNPLRLRFSGKPFIRNYEWQPGRRARFHLFEKRGGSELRTARAGPFFAFHHVNAFEDGDDVVVDVVTHPDPSVIDQLYLRHLRSAERVRATGRLARFRIGKWEDAAVEPLSDVPIELPRFDYRRAGRRHRFVYGVSDQATGDFLDSLVKIDVDRGSVLRWHEEGCYPGEPVFVDAPSGTAEDDGVVLSVVLDVRGSRSFLLVLDASTFHEVARAVAPHAIPFGFHGNYFAAVH